MAEQRLHSAMAPIDLLTREELKGELGHQVDAYVRSKYLGIDAARIPTVNAGGSNGTVNLGSIGPSDGYTGPEQGDVWLLRRVLVASSSFGDNAKYVLFRGSTPSDPLAYAVRNLLDGQQWNPSNGVTTLTQPAVPATGVAVQNTSSQTYGVLLAGGTFTQVFVNGVQVGTTSDGPYYVPAYGAISVTYSVAPTWTWSATQVAVSGTVGQNVNVAYNPGSKSGLLQPGEQIYAQIFNAVAGNVYTLTGDAIRVPAEMKGKVLS